MTKRPYDHHDLEHAVKRLKDEESDSEAMWSSDQEYMYAGWECDSLSGTGWQSLWTPDGTDLLWNDSDDDGIGDPGTPSEAGLFYEEELFGNFWNTSQDSVMVDILLDVLGHCTLSSLRALALCSTGLRDLVYNDYVWKQQISRLDPLAASAKPADITSREYCRWLVAVPVSLVINAFENCSHLETVGGRIFKVPGYCGWILEEFDTPATIVRSRFSTRNVKVLQLLSFGGVLGIHYRDQTLELRRPGQGGVWKTLQTNSFTHGQSLLLNRLPGCVEIWDAASMNSLPATIRVTDEEVCSISGETVFVTLPKDNNRRQLRAYNKTGQLLLEREVSARRLPVQLSKLLPVSSFTWAGYDATIYTNRIVLQHGLEQAISLPVQFGCSRSLTLEILFVVWRNWFVYAKSASKLCAVSITGSVLWEFSLPKHDGRLVKLEVVDDRLFMLCMVGNRRATPKYVVIELDKPLPVDAASG